MFRNTLNKVMKYLLILFFSAVSFAQIHSSSEKPVIIVSMNDNPIVLGEYSEDNCKLNFKTFAPENSPIYVTKYYECPDSYVKYYKVYHNGLPYLTYEADVKLKISDEKAVKNGDSLYLANLESETLKEAKSYYEKTKLKADKLYNIGKTKGLLIKHAIIVDESEYTNGTGFKIGVKNLSKKGIKYLWVSVKGLNRVNDAVGTKTVKIIGEIEPGGEGSAEFEYVWLTDIVDNFKLTSIKIQYMDGSFATILNADNLIVPASLSTILFTDH